MKCGVGDLEKSVEELYIWLKSDKNIGRCYVGTEVCCIVDRTTKFFSSPILVQGIFIVVFRWQH